MKKIWFVIGSVCTTAIVIFFLPAAAISILILNVFIALILASLPLVSTFTTTPPTHAPSRSDEPFVSIHVPCHNEPFDVIRQTLTSLANLKYSKYEVIVVDNNTHDPKIWKPIQAYCRILGPRFKFLHFENLRGYKAGALNEAIKHMDPRAEIMSIIDADYVVKDTLLQEGVAPFADSNVAIVQYPQAYYNTTPSTRGIESEYRSFFDNILEQANRVNAVTVTGTLSLLRASLFSSKELGWNEWCITEDAEIGIHLHSLGYKGIFINRILGQGLMPFNYYSLRRQRERWTHGNTQILRKDFISILSNPKLTWQQKMSFLTQLTAWLHPLYVPLLFFTFAMLAAALIAPSNSLLVMAGMSVLTLIGFIVARVLYFARSLHRRHMLTVYNLAAVVLTHFGLTSTMSLTWLWALITPRLPFNRTAKDPAEKVMAHMPIDTLLAVSVLLSSSLAVTMTTGLLQIIAAFGAAIGCFLLIAVWYTVWEAGHAKTAAYQTLAPQGVH